MIKYQTMTNKPVVTRFAPSPTGNLHVGGARTAIYNYLYAKKHNGKFLLRIEDSDLVRSKSEFTDEILNSLKWLGLKFDGTEVYQTQNTDLYKQCIDKLINSGDAYRCTCTQDQLEKMREVAKENKQVPKYDGTCRSKNISLDSTEPFVVRFKIPQDFKIKFIDEVKGELSFESKQLDDFVIQRKDGSATFLLCNVVDDNNMGVTHVIRGDDHLNNTPKQVLLYQALEFNLPFFAHIPMILGPDKAKLSKRHGAQAVSEYKKLGYLSSALVNGLSRLGWSHGDEEIFTLDELCKKFDLAGCGKSPSVFDTKKLLWFNKQHFNLISNEQLIDILKNDWGLDLGFMLNNPLTLELFTAVKERLEYLGDFKQSLAWFLSDDFPIDEKVAAKVAKKLKPEIIQTCKDLISQDSALTKEKIDNIFTKVIEQHQCGFGDIGRPLRLALTGQGGGADLKLILQVLPISKILKRIENILK